jgi:hypothetical protein
MRDLTQKLLLLAVGIIGGMLLFRYSCAGDDKTDELIRRNEQLIRRVDSLEAVNRLRQGRIDSLQRVDAINRRRADSLALAIRENTRIITRIVRDLNVYKGTPTDLLREFNQLIRDPLPPLPDTSRAR